jgi:hypothetical protein
MGYTSADVRMPFGQHKGDPLGIIPSAYLTWALEECKTWDPGLRQDLADELTRRAELRWKQKDLKKIVVSWRRQMLARYPDSPKALAVIRESANLLRSMLEEIE